jgi:EAL and modified HD-GYP domain-containing signal transduction protein
MSSAFLARQPILDREQSVAGYELVYPHRDADDEQVDDALSTARVAVTALSEIGLENLVGQSRAWISVAPEFLSHDLARNLPPERVVLQLGAESFGDRTAVDVVTELQAAGYQLALDQFRYQPGLKAVLGMVDFVKVDMAALGARELAHQSFELKPFNVTLVAQKVENPEDFRLAKAAGADLFQGFFFCRPHLVGARAILPSRIALMQLAAALQDPAIQLSDLEQLISADVGLSYRLLKYINSAFFGLRGRISSIKQATALLGIANLRPWATLTTMADLGDKPRELFVTALIRAHFCEQAGEAKDGTAAERFTLGLFSVLDALTDISMHTALKNLPLTPSTRDALIHHTGPGRLLTCVMAIEQGDFDRADEILHGASEHYLEAVAWSNDKGRQLIG